MSCLTVDVPPAATNRIEVTDALAMWSTWHLDHPPSGSTGIYALDLRLADAFRMLIFLRSDDERLDWIHRQVSDPCGNRTNDPYRRELCRWWLDIFENQRTAA